MTKLFSSYKDDKRKKKKQQFTNTKNKIGT